MVQALNSLRLASTIKEGDCCAAHTQPPHPVLLCPTSRLNPALTRRAHAQGRGEPSQPDAPAVSGGEDMRCKTAPEMCAPLT